MRNKHGSGRHALRAMALLAGLACVAPALQAQQKPEPLRAAVQALLERETAGLPGEVKLSVGEIDARTQLPECMQPEAFLPAGVRAWGKLSVGVRCDSPVVWSIYVPAQVVVIGDYLVAARPLRAGQIVGADDLQRVRGDLAQQAERTLTDPLQAIGHHMRYAVASGNPLRADMLRLPPAVRQGQRVRVVGVGEGFTVSNEGQAMNAAGEGEPVRVRLSGGQVVSGTARAGGVVEVRY